MMLTRLISPLSIRRRHVASSRSRNDRAMSNCQRHELDPPRATRPHLIGGFDSID